MARARQRTGYLRLVEPRTYPAEQSRSRLLTGRRNCRAHRVRCRKGADQTGIKIARSLIVEARGLLRIDGMLVVRRRIKSLAHRSSSPFHGVFRQGSNWNCDRGFHAAWKGFEPCTCGRKTREPKGQARLGVHTGDGLGVSAYRCVGVAVRNRQNQLCPPSPLRPVVTRRARPQRANSHFVSMIKSLLQKKTLYMVDVLQ